MRLAGYDRNVKAVPWCLLVKQTQTEACDQHVFRRAVDLLFGDQALFQRLRQMRLIYLLHGSARAAFQIHARAEGLRRRLNGRLGRAMPIPKVGDRTAVADHIAFKAPSAAEDIVQ